MIFKKTDKVMAVKVSWVTSSSSSLSSSSNW
jgi:hypothetical protein